ncbi:hypothetical protein MVEN_01123200 [Mycena venus]|uniref:F-box domain-containing protein n=1 Tax=Mycena venus TaxID=2733690 RepID=A0A8H6Y829_9AGAR|nr:hypothetical protein MVEN_01123200 [Mycena venus]
MALKYAQWGRVDLSVPMADFLVFNEIAGPFPALGSLSLQVTDRFRPFSDIQINAVRHSPNLKALQLMDQLCAPTAVDDLAILPHTLQALRFLHSESAFWEDFTRIVDHLPHLLHFGTAAYWQPVLNDPRVSASVTSLRVSCERVLDFLTIPTLEHLHVCLTEEDAPMVNFIAHSQCHLTTLSLEVYEDLSDEAFISSLSAVDALRTLVLLLPHRGRLNAARYRLLQRSNVLPQLRVLIITDLARTPVYEPFIVLLQARPALVHAELHMRSWDAFVRRNMPPPPAHVEEELAALVDRGMTVRMTTQTYAWPWNAEDGDPVGDLDVDVFGIRHMRPHFFSPF